MNLNQILSQCSDQGIKLWVEGDQLKVRSPKGKLIPEIRDLLLQHKAQLLQLLQSQKAQISVDKIPLIPQKIVDNLPLSDQQKRLWTVAQLRSNDGALNISQVLRLSGLLNLPILQQSWAELVQRHAILRTVFSLKHETVSQVVLPQIDVPILVEKGQDLSADAQQQYIQAISQPTAQPVFDLATGPLFHLKLLRLSQTESLLVAVFHHIISDALSINILLQELLTLYDARLDQKPSPLTALGIQYSDYVLWKNQWLQDDLLSQGLQYWQAQLANVSTLYPVPVDQL
ncbi:MAG: condensation domain-containing protein [Cyanobacteria bacterium P01_H01_bin.121]